MALHQTVAGAARLAAGTTRLQDINAARLGSGNAADTALNAEGLATATGLTAPITGADGVIAGTLTLEGNEAQFVAEFSGSGAWSNANEIEFVHRATDQDGNVQSHIIFYGSGLTAADYVKTATSILSARFAMSVSSSAISSATYGAVRYVIERIDVDDLPAGAISDTDQIAFAAAGGSSQKATLGAAGVALAATLGARPVVFSTPGAHTYAPTEFTNAIVIVKAPDGGDGGSSIWLDVGGRYTTLRDYGLAGSPGDTEVFVFTGIGATAADRLNIEMGGGGGAGTDGAIGSSPTYTPTGGIGGAAGANGGVLGQNGLTATRLNPFSQTGALYTVADGGGGAAGGNHTIQQGSVGAIHTIYGGDGGMAWEYIFTNSADAPSYLNSAGRKSTRKPAGTDGYVLIFPY